LTARGYGFVLFGLFLLWLTWRYGRSETLVTAVLVLLMPVLAVLGVACLPRRPRYLRHLPSALVQVGERLEVVLEPGPWSRPLADPIVDLGVYGGQTARPRAWLAGRSQAVLSYQLTPASRGRITVGPALLRRGDPLGLARRRELVAQPVELLVAPRRVEVSAPQIVHEGHEQSSARINTPKVPDPAQVRAYQSGDPRRLVHWRATARRGKLMVRGETTRNDVDVCLLVDNTVKSARRSPGDQSAQGCEQAIAVAAALGRVYLRRGHRLLLCSTAGQSAVFEADGGTDAYLQYLAELPLAKADAAAWLAPLTQLICQNDSVFAAIALLAELDQQRQTALGEVAGACEWSWLWLAPGGLASTKAAALSSSPPLTNWPAGWLTAAFAEYLPGEALTDTPPVWGVVDG
jgi:uncharacterized protein (DUF58 family)